MKKQLLLLSILLFASIQLHAKIYAVVVGVEQYDGTITNLQASVDDAMQVYRYIKSGKGNQVVLLTDQKATKQNILYAMQKVFSLAGENDMILFYFSGHGAPGMFCPTNIKYGRMGLLHTEIKNAFKASKAKNKLCIADACYAGSIRTTNSSSTVSTGAYGDTNVVVFMSSRENELSIENRIVNAGIFTKYFIKGIAGAADTNNDRGVSLYELYVYVRKNVRIDTHKKQTPIMYGRFNKHTIISKY